MSPRPRFAPLLPLLPLLLLTGCGIRPTGVPTDFGAAPSRAPCAMRPGETAAQASDAVTVPLYLVCREQLVSVDREVRQAVSDTDRVRVAQALLDELRKPAPPAEKDAGLSTDVRADLSVAEPLPGDPAPALRLSAAPDALSDFALAQIICTYAHSPATAADTDTVILAGPGKDDAPARYTCTDELRAAPGAGEIPGEPVSP